MCNKKSILLYFQNLRKKLKAKQKRKLDKRNVIENQIPVFPAVVVARVLTFVNDSVRRKDNTYSSQERYINYES